MWRWLIAAMVALTAWALAQSEENAEITPLTVWTWQASGADLAEDYGIENPQVPITVRRFSSGAELYQALMAVMQNGGEAAPDVVRVEYAFLPLLRQMNALLELGSLLPSGTKARFPAWAWKQVSDASGVYAVPTDAAPVSLVYRADLLERFKLQAPRTWAQMTSAATQLRRISRSTKLLNLDANSSLWLLSLMAASGAQAWAPAGEGYTQHLDHTGARALVTSLQGLIRNKQVTTFTTGSLEQFRALRDGQVLMSAMPVSAIGSLARVLRAPGSARYRIAALPGGTGTDWGGSSCAVTVYSARASVAAQYCLWLGTSKRAIEKSWQRDGLLPALAGPLELPGNQYLNAFYAGQDITAALKTAVQGVQAQTWVPWLPLTDAVYRKLMAMVLKGDLTLTQAMTRWQATVLFEARKAGFAVR